MVVVLDMANPDGDAAAADDYCYDDDDDDLESGGIGGFHHRRRRCQGCASTSLRVDWAAGDRVCTSCGLVNEGHLLDDRPEWREYDDDNHNMTNNRCGLIPTDESKWIGGLQPTTLSRGIFGRPTPTSHACRRVLIKAKQRMDRQMEKKHERDLKSAQLSIQIRKKKQEKKKEKRQRKSSLEMGDSDEEDDEDDDNESNDQEADDGTLVRPELESMLVQEEETALAAKAALYSDKWSLDRAIRIFGTGSEVAALAELGRQQEQQDGDDENEDQPHRGSGGRSRKKRRRKTGRLDDKLTSASRDLYTAYSMLRHAVQRLQVPDRVSQEACATLNQYAARRDGLGVRGVTFAPSSPSLQSVTRLSRTKSPPKIPQRKCTTTSSHAEGDRRTKETLRELNKLKQMGSLVAAILFYTCRNLDCSRSLVQVCASVDSPLAVKEFFVGKQDDDQPPQEQKQQQEQFIMKRDCSKAMNEIKQFFPDFVARTLKGCDVVAEPNNGTTSSVAFGISGRQQQGSLLCNSTITTSLTATATASLETCAEQMARKLRLPPVAQASIRVIVTHCQKQHDYFGESSVVLADQTLLDTRKRFIVCAAVSFFICQVGEIMQNLARQAFASDHARPVIVPCKKQRKMETKKKKERNVSVETFAPLKETKHEEKMSSQPFEIFSTSLSSLDTTCLLEEDDDDEQAMDAIALAEHRAYEMRRVWDAWREQTAWRRSTTEIERVADVALSSVEEYFTAMIFPRRKVLLEVLANQSKLTAVSATAGGDGNTAAIADSHGLRNVPLASVLLPYVTIAEPLMKQTVRQKKLWGGGRPS